MQWSAMLRAHAGELWIFSDNCSCPRFSPHGVCYRWNSGLVWLMFIRCTYRAGVLHNPVHSSVVYRSARPSFQLDVRASFWSVHYACGTTHVMEVWNLWHRILAGGTSRRSRPSLHLTAILLVQLVPRRLLSSPDELKEVNRHLAERTKELARANTELASANKAPCNFRSNSASSSPIFRSRVGL